MRPGRPEDLIAMTRLWEHEVSAGLRNSVPPPRRLERIFAGFDWEACCRVAESSAGVDGMVVVTRQSVGEMTIARVEFAAGPDATQALLFSLVQWGLGLSRAAAADIAQVWRVHGAAQWLRDLGLRPVR